MQNELTIPYISSADGWSGSCTHLNIVPPLQQMLMMTASLLLPYNHLRRCQYKVDSLVHASPRKDRMIRPMRLIVKGAGCTSYLQMLSGTGGAA